MFKKNLPLYLLIILVLGAIIFLSPKIIQLVSADLTDFTSGTEILSNGFFDQEAINGRFWTRVSTNGNSSVVPDDQGITITCGKESSDSIKLAQKAPLIAGKTYQLAVSYYASSVSIPFEAEMGFLSGGVGSKPIETKTVKLDSQFSSATQFSTPQQDHPNSYFYFKCSGANKVQIRSFSVQKFDQMPGSATQAAAISEISPEAILSATTTPENVSTVTVPVISPTPSPSISVAPSIIPTETTIMSANTIKIKPGWNIYGSGSDISGKVFANDDITAMQMLSGKWISINSKTKSPATFSASGGIYLYNSSKSDINLESESTDKSSNLNAGPGWNLLYNTSDKETSLEQISYYFASDTATGIYSLADLLNEKHASPDVYILKQNEGSVGLTKIDAKKTGSIPAKTAFWFYIFELK